VAEPLADPGASWAPQAVPVLDTRRARARRAFRGRARAVLGWAARPARLLPGLGAIACSVAGSYLLWGLGVALLVAGAFCLLLDARTPRG
jgi:hypothetical protein